MSKHVPDEYDSLIESNFLTTPATHIYSFEKAGSGTHLNTITLPDGKTNLILSNNSNGHIDVIERGK
jgi:hypothetical protein